MCGVTCVGVLNILKPSGLSPRVRGHPNTIAETPWLEGSIPACAGSPLGFWRSSPRTSVYPRVCGVTAYKKNSFTLKHGLSPRVRGHQRAHPPGANRIGSIPACAGSPLQQRHDLRSPLVYPRVCGVTVAAAGMRRKISGLSPRVRGHHEIQVGTSSTYRSIPACAGSPDFDM